MNGPVVISLNLVLVFFVKVPRALNGTVPPVGTALGPLLIMVVLVAAAPGVTVGATVFVGVGVFLGVPEAVDVGVKLGVGGGPFWIDITSSEKPGAQVGVAPPPLLPPQLRRIAPKTKNTTGVTTSHLSHRDNIKS